MNVRITKLFLFFSLMAPLSALAENGGIFFFPTLAAGTNSAQQTFIRLGLDLGYHIDENLYAGVGGFYSFGNHPTQDREIGVGPFLGYAYPVTSFLSFHLREDIDYMDQYNPILQSDGSYTHDQEYGVASTSYAGVHLRFSDNFGLSVGYALVVGLTNSALGTGRSGVTLGATIGI